MRWAALTASMIIVGATQAAAEDASEESSSSPPSSSGAVAPGGEISPKPTDDPPTGSDLGVRDDAQSLLAEFLKLQAQDPNNEAETHSELYSAIARSKSSRDENTPKGPATPGPDYYYCSSKGVQIRLIGARSAYPAFEIEVTAYCAMHKQEPPPGWHPDWKPAVFLGEYDYTTGRAQEELRSNGAVYLANLSCPPATNPWIYTAGCQVTGGSSGKVRTSLPYSGAKLSGYQRQSIMDWEASDAETQEPMDLAPRKDPPLILSPVAGQGFKDQVRIRLTPGVPNTVSTEYELQFRPKPSGGSISSTDFDWRSVGGVALHDTLARRGGVSIPSAAFGQEGQWQVRARMNVQGAPYGRPVDFGINLGLGQIPRAAVPMPGAREGTSTQMKGVDRPGVAPAPGTAPSQLQSIPGPATPGNVQQIGRPPMHPKKPEEGERRQIADP